MESYPKQSEAKIFLGLNLRKIFFKKSRTQAQYQQLIWTTVLPSSGLSIEIIQSLLTFDVGKVSCGFTFLLKFFTITVKLKC